jgi:hypothetical protein
MAKSKKTKAKTRAKRKPPRKRTKPKRALPRIVSPRGLEEGELANHHVVEAKKCIQTALAHLNKADLAMDEPFDHEYASSGQVGELGQLWAYKRMLATISQNLGSLDFEE